MMKRNQPAVTVGFGLYSTVPMMIAGIIASIYGANTGNGMAVYIGTAVLAASIILFGISMYALGFQAHERAASQPIIDDLVKYVDKKVAYEVAQVKREITNMVKRALQGE